jgi:hypothetical protein
VWMGDAVGHGTTSTADSQRCMTHGCPTHETLSRWSRRRR